MGIEIDYGGFNVKNMGTEITWHKGSGVGTRHIKDENVALEFVCSAIGQNPDEYKLQHLDDKGATWKRKRKNDLLSELPSIGSVQIK